MKKKFIVTLLSLATVAAVLTGCGSNSTEHTTPDKDVSTEVEVLDEDTKDDKELEKDNEEKDVKQDHNYTAEDIVNSIDSENFGISMNREGFTITMMTSEENMLMSYSYFLDSDGFNNLLEVNETNDELKFDIDKINADGGYNMNVAIYKVDNEVYCCSNLYGTNIYMKMKADDENADDLFEDMTTSDEIGIKKDSISNIEYIDTIDYNGTTVDLVNVTSKEDEVITFYINPKTGLTVAMAIKETEEGASNETIIVDICSDKIVLPAEFTDAEEVSSDEIMSNMMGIMFLPMYSLNMDETGYDYSVDYNEEN